MTPKGSKAKGLLALLCGTQDYKRGRRWLESKLWSGRSPSQASGSLRQTLTEIRAAFGEFEDAFCTSRVDIWLDPELVETDLSDDADFRQSDRDFLEGLEIRDEAFDDWLRTMRSRYDGTAQTAPVTGNLSKGLKIRVALSEAETPMERISSNIIADQVAKSLEERLSGSRFASSERMSGEDVPDLEIRCDVAEDGGNGVVFLRVENGHDGRVLFSGHRSVSGGAASAISSETIAGLTHSAAAKITHRLPSALDLSRPEAAALGFSSLGLRKLAHFDDASLNDADEFFTKAHEADENGVYLAWRAFAHMAKLIESADGGQSRSMDEIDRLTADSLQNSADNGLAVALVALTRIMLEDDLQAPAELAEQAMRWNENNLFARQTLAVAHSAVGDTEAAYELSKACRRSAPEDELGHLWDLYHALVCISSGRVDEARLAAQRASNAAPGFIAPRRQLVALCANAGDLESAKSYLNELQTLEKGFSLDRYLNDEDYPVLTLRNAGLLKGLSASDLKE